MKTTLQHFACTQCGKCCNRSPEVELSEAAALADVFVFRLMFRLYRLPRRFSDYRQRVAGPANAAAVFHQRKRLLGACAAATYRTRIKHDGKAVEYTKYLMASALALDTSPGACTALGAKRCSIYDRRPLACRTVPFHYARPEALAESDLKAFVGTPGFECDTGAAADVILEAGKIANAGIRQGRADALALARRDRPWKEAITRRLNAGSPGSPPLPSLTEIEANARFGATTTPMRAAWQIAADSGLIGADQCRFLIATQLAAIDQELALARCAENTRQTLAEMRAEYRHHLNS